MINEFIVNEAVKEINNLPKGTEFAFADILSRKNIAEAEMFDYFSAVYKKVKNNVEIPKEYSELFLGLPYNIPYVKK